MYKNVIAFPIFTTIFFFLSYILFPPSPILEKLYVFFSIIISKLILNECTTKRMDGGT